MSEHNRIVVGIDGSEAAAKAAVWAATWAGESGRAVHLIQAVKPTASGVPERALAEAQESLATVAASIDTGLGVTSEIAETNPVTAMVQASRSADALVLGTGGEDGWAGLPVGSVASNIAASVYCPTVIIPPTAEPTPHAGMPVVVGVDGSPEGAAAVRYAAELAHSERRPLLLAASGPDASALDELLQRTSAAVERAVPGQRVDTRVSDGDRREFLSELSEEAALVVLATHGHHGVGGFLLGETSQAMVGAAHCPVLVLTARSLGMES
ncbi:MAG: universal stress protein [Micrococcales bacterium]|nr:universal stress protein [Micrococcales bacterium]